MIPNASTAWGCAARSVIRFQNHRCCYKHTVTHLKHFNVSIMTQVSYKALFNKRNNWLAGKCYIATMLFDSCRAHTFKSSHMRLCVLFPDGHEFNNIYCFFSQILTVSPSRFAGLFYCCSLLNHCFRTYYCGKRVGGNERFRGHELRIRYYDLNCSRI